MPLVTRFAPSPTGYLHLGHAHSALVAWGAARIGKGRFLLRIEDIDLGRIKPEYEAAIYEDLAWLGLEWEAPVRRQSEHFQDYTDAIGRLAEMNVLYPCFCTRKEIREEILRSGVAPHGPEDMLYPGTCRRADPMERQARIDKGDPHALRLDLARAMRLTGALSWEEQSRGEIMAEPELLGDVVLARKDIPTSYHLSVTVDDALQGVTLVTRGADLFEATHIHRLLQALLGLPTPDYHHHPLISGPDGQRLAKREKSLTIRALREAGKSAGEVIEMAGFGG